ncbi:MAG: acyl-CoA dehydrogenase, partial [Xanthobacteraceae bacterium]
DYITKPIFGWARGALPSISETEREALTAGDVWWDAELFSGNPDWKKLLGTPPAKLSSEEAAFLAGPVEELCEMVDDWKINWELGDLPPEVWAFLKRHKFFGMIIPKKYGGLGFSAFAHSEVVRKISSRSAAAAVTVMVPNSLGPGELLLQFGTDAQRKYWLPRLADGREIPCFGLTSPEAGSDAAAMTDKGVVIRTSDGLAIRLNWHKRYITLGPVATVMGLAFKLYDPDHLLGPKEERGITVALVPTDLPGVEIGRRHLPAMQFFQNGPNRGRGVVIPIDDVIGGATQVGHGWKMLMSALAAGRGVSLPSLSAAGAALAARTTGAYARVREQFNVPIGKFEGVQRRLARLAATAYLLDAGRRLTCAGLDEGRKLAVISAIMKAHATYRLRDSVNDAMDVHAGKAVIDGPLNYLGNLYRAIPVGITVEGANILTRNLIIFGQGAIRCHPFLLKEMLALEDQDRGRGLDQFDRAFWSHIWHSTKTFFRALGRSWTAGYFAPAPQAGAATPYYKQIARYSACFALTADIALLTLGGSLKRREMLSARLGDILSELYLLSAALKRWEDEGRKPEDLPVLAWCMETGLEIIDDRFGDVFANLPSRIAAWILRIVVQPGGPRRRGPDDALTVDCAELLLSPSAARERLTPGLCLGYGDDAVARLERAFKLVHDTEPIRKKVRAAGLHDWREARKQKAIDAADAKRMEETDAAVQKVIEVDDFAPEELGPRVAVPGTENPKPARAEPRRAAAKR